MHDEQHDVLQFELVGGRPCLDFANHGERMLRCADPYAGVIDLSLALRLLGQGEAESLLLEAARREDVRREVVRRVEQLGSALTGLFTAAGAGGTAPASALRVLNREVADAYANAEIGQHDGEMHWRWRESSPPALERPLWPLARDAADLLTAHDSRRIKACAWNPCRWLFLDASKNGRRRWCDMAVCGNRAKARRYRERRRAAS